MTNLIKELTSLYLLKEVRENFHLIEDLINNEYIDENKIVEILSYIENKTIEMNEKHVGIIPNYLKIFEESDIEEFRYYIFTYIYPELEEMINVYDNILLNRFKKNSFIQ